jgi:hypothetical protein
MATAQPCTYRECPAIRGADTTHWHAGGGSAGPGHTLGWLPLVAAVRARPWQCLPAAACAPPPPASAPSSRCQGPARPPRPCAHLPDAHHHLPRTRCRWPLLLLLLLLLLLGGPDPATVPQQAHRPTSSCPAGRSRPAALVLVRGPGAGRPAAARLAPLLSRLQVPALARIQDWGLSALWGRQKPVAPAACIICSSTCSGDRPPGCKLTPAVCLPPAPPPPSPGPPEEPLEWHAAVPAPDAALSSALPRSSGSAALRVLPGQR